MKRSELAGSGGLGAAVRAREVALRRFESLEAAFPIDRDAPSAVAGIGWLYDLLPLDARQRPVDPSGVRSLHAALSVLRSDAHR